MWDAAVRGAERTARSQGRCRIPREEARDKVRHEQREVEVSNEMSDAISKPRTAAAAMKGCRTQDERWLCTLHRMEGACRRRLLRSDSHVARKGHEGKRGILQ